MNAINPETQVILTTIEDIVAVTIPGAAADIEIAKALENLIVNAVAAYQAQVGEPYDLTLLTAGPDLPLDPGTVVGSDGKIYPADDPNIP